MTTLTRTPSLLLAISALLVGGAANAQVIEHVNVMPGYPNAPRTSPDQRRLARPGVGIALWGNANNGDGTASGMTYTWTVTPGTDVDFVDDGSLTGPIAMDHYIEEGVIFNLLNGATSGLAVATLSVTDGTSTREDTVEIAIVDPSDPLSDTALEDQQINANMAIDDGLRFLYTRQMNDGSWQGAGSQIGPTGYSLWAMQNQGHLATNDHDEDILASTVQRGLNYLFEECVISSDVSAPNADVARGATAAGISDMNSNGQAISFGSFGWNWGYEHPIATAALAASVSPAEIVGVGPAAGMTYAELGEDCLDMIGFGQQEVGPGSGGWRYSPNDFDSDMSVNSWHYVAMEGLQVTFGIDIPDWILQECEMNLVYHQSSVAGPSPFGYTDHNPLMSPIDGHATTGGGLAGLCAVEFQGPHTSAGTVISGAPAPLDSISAKRNAALEYLGDEWGKDGFNLGEGNRGNTYSMWTVARSLRLTAFAQGLPAGDAVQLVNSGVSFDWETGEEGGSGVLAAPGSVREGYFTYLVRSQGGDGSWNIDYLGDTLDTALAVLILTPKVFLVDPPDGGGDGDGDGEEDLDDALFAGIDVDIKTSQVWGSIAAGNDLSVETCNLGIGVSPEDTDTMIAERDIYAHIGNLEHGNVVAGSSLNIAPTFTIAGGTQAPRIESVIDFATLLGEITSMTTTLGALAPTGTTTAYQDNLDLVAHSGAAIEIFLVTAAQMEVARHLMIEVDAGSAALVNIEGGNLNPMQFGIELVGVSSDMVLFNAFEASHVRIADVNFDGSLVVQGGDVEIFEIDVAGQLIAGGSISIETTRVFGSLFGGNLEDALPFMAGVPMQEPEDVLLHNLVLESSTNGSVTVAALDGTPGAPLVVTVDGHTRHFRIEKVAQLTVAGITDPALVDVDASLGLEVHFLESAPLGGDDVYLLGQMDVPERGRGLILMDLFANDLAGASGVDANTFRVVKNPEHGVVRYHEASGRVWFAWGSAKWLEDSFEYTLMDGNGVCSAPVSVRIIR